MWAAQDKLVATTWVGHITLGPEGRVSECRQGHPEQDEVQKLQGDAGCLPELRGEEHCGLL